MSFINSPLNRTIYDKMMSASKLDRLAATIRLTRKLSPFLTTLSFSPFVSGNVFDGSINPYADFPGGYALEEADGASIFKTIFTELVEMAGGNSNSPVKISGRNIARLARAQKNLRKLVDVRAANIRRHIHRLQESQEAFARLVERSQGDLMAAVPYPHIYSTAKALLSTFDGWASVVESSLVAVTQPVVLEQDLDGGDSVTHEVGRLALVVRLDHVNRPLCVYPFTIKPVKAIGNYWHPHINTNHVPCLNDYQSSIMTMLRMGYFAEALQLVAQILSACNPDSPYCALEHIAALSFACESCGRDVLHPDAVHHPDDNADYDHEADDANVDDEEYHSRHYCRSCSTVTYDGIRIPASYARKVHALDNTLRDSVEYTFDGRDDYEYCAACENLWLAKHLHSNSALRSHYGSASSGEFCPICAGRVSTWLNPNDLKAAKEHAAARWGDTTSMVLCHDCKALITAVPRVGIHIPCQEEIDNNTIKKESAYVVERTSSDNSQSPQEKLNVSYIELCQSCLTIRSAAVHRNDIAGLKRRLRYGIIRGWEHLQVEA